MKTEAIIFDLDGTLLNTIEDIAGAGNIMLRRKNFPEHPVDKYIEWIGEGAHRLVSRTMPGDMNISDEQLNDYLKEFRDIYEENIYIHTHIYEGISEMLDQLKASRIPISILSNKPHYLTEKLYSILLEDWDFDVVLGQRKEVPRKPDPAAALEIAEILKTVPGKMLFIGDSGVDIKTAKAAGMTPLGVTWGYNGREKLAAAGCELFAESASEIINFVRANSN